jgi:photosystem II stability/assembly factor-like uncharacterized protein
MAQTRNFKRSTHRIKTLADFISRLLMLTLLAMLSACQTPAGKGTPTASLVLTVAPSLDALPTAPASWVDGIDMADAKSGWAWKGDSQLYRTDDGGATWTEVHLQGKMQVVGATFLSGQEAWLPGAPNADLMQAIYHTADGGKSWAALSSLHGPNIEVFFNDSKNGWALNGVGGAGNVFYQVSQTQDGGHSWTRLQPSSGGNDHGPMAGTLQVASGDAVTFRAPNTIWIASGSGASLPAARLTVSRDAGETWQDVNLPLPAEYLAGKPPVSAGAPQFVSNQDAFVPVTVGNRLVFFASQDAGKTWTLLPPSLIATHMVPRVQFVNQDDGFAVCGPNLCTTHDGAASWQAITAPFSFNPSGGGVHVSQFDFVDKDTGWAILTDQNGHTRLIKTTDGRRTWIDLEPRVGF